MLGTLVTLAALVAADGGSWTTTFEEAAVGSYVPQASARLLVAAGGEDRAATQPAAAALQQALRASGRTQLVMDDQGLGSLAGLDDAAIVARAAKLPVDGIMVIRVFPGGPGAPATAVVTSYDPKGAVQVAFSAQQGQALARRDGATEAAQGVSQAAAATVDSITKSAVDKGSDADEQYDLRRVWFQEMAAVNTGNGAVVAQWSVPYKGKYKEPLEGAAFYDYVGHPEYAAQFRARMSRRIGLVAGGGALMTAGMALGTWGLLKAAAYVSPDYSACSDVNWDAYDACSDAAEAAAAKKETDARAGSKPMMYVGYGAAAIGIGVLWAGLVTNPHPVDSVAARKMADEYNKKLRRELGLSASADEPEPLPQDDPEVKLAMAPWIGPSGGGLTLSLTF